MGKAGWAAAMALALGSSPAAGGEGEGGASWGLARVSVSRVYYVDMGSIKREGAMATARALVSYPGGGSSSEGFKSMSFTARLDCERGLFWAFDFKGWSGAMGAGEGRELSHKVEASPYGESSPIWSVAGLACAQPAP